VLYDVKSDFRIMDCFSLQISITQQLLVRSYPNLAINLRWPNQILQILQPPMEDDLKILKVEYQPWIGSSSIFKLKLRGPN
jgi:hypothetical protein